MTQTRRMICFDEDDRRFQLRAAGIALRDGRLLVHRALHQPFWSLPGGRVEFGEMAEQALRREMLEELGVEVDVGPPVFTCESMFSLDGRQFHEVGLYLRMEVPPDFGREEGICHRVKDGFSELEFTWIPADVPTLDAAPFHPAALRQHLPQLPETMLHLLDIEPAA